MKGAYPGRARARPVLLGLVEAEEGLSTSFAFGFGPFEDFDCLARAAFFLDFVFAGDEEAGTGTTVSASPVLESETEKVAV
jgi:hypothetical protein